MSTIFFAILAYFFESVETTIFLIYFDCRQVFIDQAISGLPFNLLIFLFFIPLDPALARIIAIVSEVNLLFPVA